MKFRILTIVLLICCLAQMGCAVSKSSSYAYKTKTYSINPDKKLLSVASLISYKDYLFEFITQVNIEDSITSGFQKRQISYDSKGEFYLLKNKTDLYFQFDDFSKNNKLIRQGKIAEKSMGVQFSGYDTSLSSNRSLYKTLPLDTIINNVQCFYIDINLAANNTAGKDYEQKIFLYKSKHFNSFYKLWNATYLNPAFCIIGMYFIDRDTKQGFMEEPEAVRTLTKEEQKICEAVIKKAKF